MVFFAPIEDANVFRGDRTIGHLYGDSLFEWTDKTHGWTLLTTSWDVRNQFGFRMGQGDDGRHPQWRIVYSVVEGNGLKV